MNAQEAYELAETKGKVDYLLELIKKAAEKGNLALVTPALNTFQVTALQRLGYVVYAEYGERYARLGNSNPDCSRISWNVTKPQVNNFGSIHDTLFDTRNK